MALSGELDSLFEKNGIEFDKDAAEKIPFLVDQNEDLEKLRNELRKVQKELQEYKINEVGKQQQQFIQ